MATYNKVIADGAQAVQEAVGMGAAYDPVGDSGHAVEAFTISPAVIVTQAGAGIDSLLFAMSTRAADTGQGVDAASLVPVVISLVDANGAVVETIGPAVNLIMADQGNGFDVTQLTKKLFIMPRPESNISILNDRDIADVKLILAELAPVIEEEVIYLRWVSDGAARNNITGQPKRPEYLTINTTAMVRGLTLREIAASGGRLEVGDIEFTFMTINDPDYRDRIVYDNKHFKPKQIGHLSLKGPLWWEIKAGKE